MAPKKPQSRIKRHVNLTLDPESLDRLEALKEANGLESISHTVRWLAREAELRRPGRVKAAPKPK